MTEMLEKKVTLVILYNYHSFFAKLMSSLLEKKGYDVEVIFFKELYDNSINKPTEKEYELLLEHIRKTQPKIVLVSALSSSISEMTLDVIAKIKSLGVPVALGGVASTVNPEDYIEQVDYICVGEGEYTVLELLDSIFSGRDANNIKGLWINNKGTIIKNSLRTELFDLDEIGLIKVSDEVYIDYDQYEDFKPDTYSTMTSRGCPFSCTYCTNYFFHTVLYANNKFKLLRKRKVENVIAELLYAIKKNPTIKSIDFHDDDFFIDKNWLEEFSAKYKEKIGLPIIALTTFNFCTEDRLLLFKKGGGKTLKIGIQSGSERVRKDVYRRAYYSNEKIVSTSKLLKKHKINQLYDLIVDNPYENESDMIETLKVILALKRPFKLSIFSLIYFPKTQLTLKAIEDGFITEDDVENRKHKSLSSWRSKLENTNSKESSYYLSLYYLVDSILPRILIKFIWKLNYFKVHQEKLAVSKYVRVTNYIPKFSKTSIYLKRIMRGNVLTQFKKKT